MTRKTIHFITILFTISLTGFLVAQFFWIRGAYTAVDETFRQMNASALRSVVQQSTKITNYQILSDLGERIHSDGTVSLDTFFSPCGFDALMQHELAQYRLHREYEYGIVDHLTGKLLLSSASDDRTNLILQSHYGLNLKRAFDTERYEVVVWFPDKQMIILKTQKTWLLWLSVLLFIGIIAGYFLSVAKLQSQKRFTEVQRDFINSTTHEFKTPLATISIAAEMILAHRNHMPDNQIEKYAAIIFDENKRIQHQVDQILQLSVMENNQDHFVMKPADIQKIAEKCIEIGRLMLRDTGGEIKFEGNCSQLVECDQMHITNVINNLIENGIKYSGNIPFLTITISARDQGVMLGVADKGIGIGADQLDRIFDWMYRVPTGDIYNTTGTGIGLYYVNKVVEAHHGTISVKSKLGEGSLFEVFLPFSQQSS